MAQATSNAPQPTPRDVAVPRDYLNRIAALVKEERLESALAAADEALEHYPRNARLHAERGGVLESLGRGEEAVAATVTAAGLQPGDAALQHRASICLANQGHYERALAFAEAAAAIPPTSPGSLIQKSRMLSQLGRHEEALAAAQEAVALNPDNPRGVAHLERLKRDEARTRSAETKDARSGQATAANAAGDDMEDTFSTAQGLLNSGSLEEALTLVDRGLEADPRRAELHLLRSNVMERMGRLEDAIADARKAMALKPGDAALIKHHYRLVARERSGEPEPDPFAQPAQTDSLFQRISRFVRGKVRI